MRPAHVHHIDLALLLKNRPIEFLVELLHALIRAEKLQMVGASIQKRVLQRDAAHLFLRLDRKCQEDHYKSNQYSHGAIESSAAVSTGVVLYARTESSRRRASSAKRCFSAR